MGDALLDALADEGPVNPERMERAASKTRKPAARRKPTPRYHEGMFVEPLEQLYTMFGTMWMIKDQHCARIMVDQAHDCAVSLDALAKENENVRRALVALTTTGATFPVIMAHAPILVAIIAHHTPLLPDPQIEANNRGPDGNVSQ